MLALAPTRPSRLRASPARRLWESLSFGLQFFASRRTGPFVLGLVTNDTCNLHCRHCRVANIYHERMRYEEIGGHLERFYRRGARFVYLEGGEPYLWRDGERRLPDVVRLAREVGYLRVHVYTNGTFPLDPAPDFTWVSIDGLGETFRSIRGIEVERVLENVRGFAGRFGVVFVVNTLNYREIRAFLEFIRAELPRGRVMFFFHTPYYGVDDLLPSPAQKAEAIETILQCKRERLPVLNSRAGLRALGHGRYPHPTRLWYVVDRTGEYPCCRAYGHPEVCEQCGYATCAEIVLSRSLRPGPFWTMCKVF